MTDTFRALCAELLRGLDENRHPEVRYPGHLRQIMASARAALADEPAVPEGREPASVTGEPSNEEGPSIEDVEELCEEHCFNVEGYESIECLQGLINEAIARWGHQPAPPADGEVAELVAWLERERNAHGPMAAYADVRGRLARIATLLRQLSAAAPHPVPELEPTLREEFTMILNEARCNSPGRVIGNIELGRRLVAAVERFNSQPPGRVELLAEAADAAQALEPVPVSEHPWERTGWCDEHGRCWFGAPRDGAVDAGWILRKPSEHLSHQTASLPAHALPLPSGEVEK